MEYVTFAFQILLAAFFGGILGWQRQHIGKSAGLRTFALVSIGSTVFTVLSLQAFPGGDLGRVASQIIPGIGFICAGTIIHKRDSIDGLTTAAGLWATAAIGMAIGAEKFIPAAIATTILFFLLIFPDKKVFEPTSHKN